MATVKQIVKDLPSVVKTTAKGWVNDEAYDLGAIVAFYSIFSLPALVIIVVNIAGAVFGEAAVEGKIAEEIGTLIGQNAASEIQQMIKQAPGQGSSTISSVVGIGTLLFGATAVFIALQKSLNSLWEVEPDPEKTGIKKVIKDRATSFGIVFTMGFLLLISLLLTTGLSILSEWIREKVPDFLLYLFYVLDFLLSFGVITVVFALLYKFLPDVKIEWRSVWVGAGVTALLFIVGKFGLSLYFEKASPGSAYGAAGSIILLLLWIYYSCLIFFFGAEFTQVYALRYGHRIQPSEHAIRTPDFEENKKKKKEDVG